MSLVDNSSGNNTANDVYYHHGSSSSSNNNVGIAFGLVIGAGLSTSFGATVVFFPSLAKLANRRALASALGFSGGVMSYVSFVEIFSKSAEAFVDAGHPPQKAFSYATVSFFGGILFMVAIAVVLNRISKSDHHHHDDEDHDTSDNDDDDEEKDPVVDRDAADEEEASRMLRHKLNASSMSISSALTAVANGDNKEDNDDDNNSKNRLVVHIHDEYYDLGTPAKQLEAYQRMAQEMQEYEQEYYRHWSRNMQKPAIPATTTAGGDNNDLDTSRAGDTFVSGAPSWADNVPGSLAGDEADTFASPTTTTSNNLHHKHHEQQQQQREQNAERRRREERKRLIGTGISTAAAIAIHNFPEGLATFVAALESPSVGALLAIAIAVHNIPEGLCVAMPIYYATGNRLQAFCWATLSGLAEVFAALVGYLVLSGSFSPTLYGTLFGMVTGMMISVTVRELLPTAHRYDPNDSVVTFSFIIGMIVMAVSLVLFRLPL